MKLTTADISALKNILVIADLIGVEALVIADGKVSGINTDKTALILSDKNIPDLPEDVKLGLSRLKELKSRLDLFATDPNLSIDLKENTKKEISQIEIKGTGSSVQFRATSVNVIKYPKNVVDPAVRTVFIQRNQAKMILDAGKVMGADNIGFTFKTKEQVLVEFTDSTQDTFSLTLLDPSVKIDESDSNVVYFVFNVFAPLLRSAIIDNEIIELQICGSSALINVSGHDIRMMAQVN